MRISSTKTDPKRSNPSYCGWVTVAAGHVISISDELGREGGEIWSKKQGGFNGDLKTCMASIGRNWPNLYTKVRKEAYRDKLPPISTVKRNANARNLHLIESDIEMYENKLRDLKAKRRKLKAKL